MQQSDAKWEVQYKRDGHKGWWESGMVMENFLHKWNLKSFFKESKNLDMGVSNLKKSDLIRTLFGWIIAKRGLLP